VLQQRGHEVSALVRPAASAATPPWETVRQVRGDLRNPESCRNVLADQEAVVHLAACVVGDEETQFVNTVVGTENLLAAMRHQGVSRLVHISSFSVYDWNDRGPWLDEQTPIEPHIYARDGYAIAKLWQERLVGRAAGEPGWDVTILRPGFLWGAGFWEVAGIGHAVGPVQLVFGGARALPLTYVENCADCVAVVLDHPRAAHETFNVLDSQDVSAWRYAGKVNRQVPQKRLRVYVPYAAGMAAATAATAVSRLLFGRQGKLPSILVPARFRARFRPVKFRRNKLADRLGWQPPYTFATAWAHSHGDCPDDRSEADADVATRSTEPLSV
jgi:UDP-glucose 4-epimerase